MRFLCGRKGEVAAALRKLQGNGAAARPEASCACFLDLVDP